MAMCFIIERKTGFTQRKVAPRLSQKMNGAAGNETQSSDRTLHTQFIYEAALATALYSASVDDLATPFCFLDDHEIGCLPR